ncbi:MAG: hypothetical protein Q4D05_07310 [Acinetobacter sp.]|nr:hypothetical protein [Acinetobacter sp.]
MRYFALPLAVFSVLLSGCISDLPLRASKNDPMMTNVSYGNLAVKEDIAGSYKEFLGEYHVQKSWDNLIYNVERVVVAEQNNKLVVFTYPKDWQTPNLKTEFVRCQVIGERVKTEYSFNHTKQTFLCIADNNVFKGYNSIEIVKTTNMTTAKARIPEFYLGALLPPRQPKIETPYGISLNLLDQSVPVLAVTKVK